MPECDGLDHLLAALDADAKRVGVSRVNRKRMAREVRAGFEVFVECGYDPDEFQVFLQSDARGHARVVFGCGPMPDCCGVGAVPFSHSLH